MKIVAYKAGGNYCCRPDTTLNHNNSDYWCPEGAWPSALRGGISRQSPSDVC